MIAGTVAILASVPMLLALALRDPKRLRTILHARADVYSPTRSPATTRRVLGALVLLPGLLLVCLGEWWAVLVWLGSVMALGWAVARALARTSDR